MIHFLEKQIWNKKKKAVGVTLTLFFWYKNLICFFLLASKITKWYIKITRCWKKYNQAISNKIWRLKKRKKKNSKRRRKRRVWWWWRGGVAIWWWWKGWLLFWDWCKLVTFYCLIPVSNHLCFLKTDEGFSFFLSVSVKLKTRQAEN